MSTRRLKRPKLERDRPVRSFSSLFGDPPGGAGRSRAEAKNGAAREAAEGGANGRADPRSAEDAGAGRAVSETVEMGYRVIDDYLKQGQKVAQAFNPTAWMNPGKGGSPEELQKIAQRVMQYGWDFAGMWFEMWSRMAESGTWPAGPWMAGMPVPGPNGRKRPASSERDAANAEPILLTVEVRSERPTSTALELRPGPTDALLLQKLRPATGNGPSIDEVSLEPPSESGVVKAKVVIPADQPAGVYNAIIVDASTNLPRGTLSVTIFDSQKEA